MRLPRRLDIITNSAVPAPFTRFSGMPAYRRIHSAPAPLFSGSLGNNGKAHRALISAGASDEQSGQIVFAAGPASVRSAPEAEPKATGADFLEKCRRQRLRARSRVAFDQVRLALFVLAYTSATSRARSALPRKVSNRSLSSIQLKPVKTGAKILSH